MSILEGMKKAVVQHARLARRKSSDFDAPWIHEVLGGASGMAKSSVRRNDVRWSLKAGVAVFRPA